MTFIIALALLLVLASLGLDKWNRRRHALRPKTLGQQRPPCRCKGRPIMGWWSAAASKDGVLYLLRIEAASAQDARAEIARRCEREGYVLREVVPYRNAELPEQPNEFVLVGKSFGAGLHVRPGMRRKASGTDFSVPTPSDGPGPRGPIGG